MLLAVLAWAWWPNGQYRPVSGTRARHPRLADLGGVPTQLRPVAVHCPGTGAGDGPGGATGDHPVLLLTQGSDGLRAI